MDKPLVASIVVAVATSSSIPVQADIVDLYLGAAVWQASVSGEAQDGATLIDIEDDLGLDDDTSNFFYARLEHSAKSVHPKSPAKTSRAHESAFSI